MTDPVASGASYKEAILFLATAGVVVPLFLRLRISPVLGFIGAGALLGPSGLGRLTESFPWLANVTIGSRTEIAHLAELGVIFLMFMIGVELSWERLRILRRLVFGLGSLQVLVSGAVLGGVLLLLGIAPLAAALVGLALALSSTAIVLPVLADQKRLNTPAGRASFAVLLFQDLAVAPVLFAIAVLGRKDGDAVSGLALALGQAAVAVAIIVVAGRLGLRPLFQLVARTRSPELFMAACLLVIVATSLVAAASGLSMTLGAFVAGLLLAETEYRRAIEATIDPFKGLLLGVFFVSVGMNLDPAQLLSTPATILGLALAVIALKGGVILAVAAALRLPRAVAVEAALLLGAGGEFAFVLIGSALTASLVPEDLGQAALIVTTVTMVMIPGLAALARRLGRRFDRAASAQQSAAEPLPETARGRVIIAGYGRVGRLVGEMLDRHKVPYIALDMDAARVAEQRRQGRPVYFGDSANTELLRRCGIATARALVVTLDTPRLVEAVVAAGRAERPDLTIVARARDARHATALYDLGVDDAVPETIEASLQLSEAVLVDVGVPMGLVIASIHERRDEFRALLKRKEEAPAPEFQARRTVGKAG
ncbi:cation:proton antiporter domain-containing protein [Methylobacterium isbiliense]|jgi:CPA2 family monovalent cation:H+ antiporter-2|uniref:Glutathione-regulated potassium-efflux system protein KefC n=1 Tax=Methylobacterium isbiliense TaxID=315478 RepID=A0ABQ4SLZ2_9HYPH|nr:cation:proton antiporter [Methylobacterium isbiliense]MDN3625695.1 cation:proton antiporter [Methylobacterium isbiliense]GJE04244.1 Glutathione-regulated potassium-efflux system protein KefC [Methylobacterium isbiliense]